jgi:hypothetical protein
LDADRDGHAEAAGWLYRLWGVIDPPQPGDQDVGDSELDPCAVNGCRPDPPDSELEMPADGNTPIRDPNDTGPITHP